MRGREKGLTKKELSQLTWLKKEIERKRRCLAELEAAARNTTHRISGLPGMRGIVDRTSIAAAIADIRALLQNQLARALAEYKKLNYFINTIEDSKVRQILTLRYIEEMSWQSIARELGEHDEQYPRKLHNKFLAESILDEKDESDVI